MHKFFAVQNLSSINFTMVSFDNKSLLANIPSNGALDCLEKGLREFHYIYLKYKIYYLILVHVREKQLFLSKQLL